MVMCDVGIKCSACVNKTKSHVTQLDKKHLLLAGGGSVVAGLIFGSIYLLIKGLPFWLFGIPVLPLLVSFAVGRGIGGLLQRLTRKMGGPIALIVTVGGSVGLLAGPFGQVLLSFMAIFHSAQNIQGYGSTSASFFGFDLLVNLALAYVFIHGLRGAFLYK